VNHHPRQQKVRPFVGVGLQQAQDASGAFVGCQGRFGGAFVIAVFVGFVSGAVKLAAGVKQPVSLISFTLLAQPHGRQRVKRLDRGDRPRDLSHQPSGVLRRGRRRAAAAP
jgi:hypothetical protein